MAKIRLFKLLYDLAYNATMADVNNSLIEMKAMSLILMKKEQQKLRPVFSNVNIGIISPLSSHPREW